jgi:hypothetical protein
MTPEIVWYPPGAHAFENVPLAITRRRVVRFGM